MLFTFIGVGMAVLVGFLADLLRKRAAKAVPQTPKATTARPQKVHVGLQHVLADNGALVRDGACLIMPVAGGHSCQWRGRHSPVGAPVVVGRRQGGRVTNMVAGAHVGTAAGGVGAAEKRGCSSAGCAGFAAARGGPITLSW